MMKTVLTVIAFLLLFAAPAGTAAEDSAQGSSGTAPIEDFKPSTRLPADQAVAFPVDI